MNTEALLKAPSLDDQFPLDFRNGFKVAGLGFWCLSCGEAIPLTAVHGHVGRIVERVVDITAASSCSCGETNLYRIRLHDDATCSYVREGKWVKESAATHGKLGILGRLRLQLLFLTIRWKCFWLARTLKTMQRDFRQKYRLKPD